MNREEVNALVSTLNDYVSGAQYLPAHIAEMLRALRDQTHVDSSAAINEANRVRHAEERAPEHPYGQAGPIGIVRDNPSHDPGRSISGHGQQCFIYVLGRADQYADSVVPSYGQISAGCGPNIREDFAETIWPVVVKVKPHVTERDLIQHLRDLADAIEEHTKPKDMQRTLGARWLRQQDHIEPTEKERRLGIVASGDLDSEIPF